MNRASQAAGVRGQVEVLLADDATLRRLNRNFRYKNKPTDVLSFPAPREVSAHSAGDLAISLETAARQAAAYGHSLRDEVRILLLHGLLHLSGLDHETDAGEMAAREVALRRELHLRNSLIERTDRSAEKPASSSPKKSSPGAKALRSAAATNGVRNPGLSAKTPNDEKQPKKRGGSR